MNSSANFLETAKLIKSYLKFHLPGSVENFYNCNLRFLKNSHFQIPDDLADKTCLERIDLFAERIVQSVKHANISVTALLEAAVRIRNFSGAKIARFQQRYEKMVNLIFSST